jgi:phosphoglycerate-specific signal transduction histidine kinase
MWLFRPSDAAHENATLRGALRFTRTVIDNLNAELATEKAAREKAQIEARGWMRDYADACRERDALRVQVLRDRVSIDQLTQMIDDLTPHDAEERAA